MESVLTHATVDWGRPWRKLDQSIVSAWVLTGAVLLYLAFDGGGYSLAAHSQVGIIVWWIVVVCAAWGLLPVRAPTRIACAALTLLIGFVGWTALATTWSISSGRSLQDLGLVSCYLGVFVLAVALHRERASAIRHTVGAVAAAITLVAAAAVASRLWPHLFPGSLQTDTFLQGARARLAWPLNYWNGLAAFVDLGVPLLLVLATSARTLRAQALAAAALPIVVLCAALTVSRGGMVAGATAVVVFFALAPERLPKLATAATAAAGSAILVAAAFDRHALQQGLANSAASHEAGSLLAAIAVVCLGVALVQLGIGLAVRHGTPPRLLVIGRPTARRLLVLGIGVIVAAGIATGTPSQLAHVWHQFKVGSSQPPASSLSRFGATSGDGRYQYWTTAVHATGSHVIGGSGPGTFQELWLPRATFRSYVENAHSLYFETLAEEGVVGLALIVGFLLLAFAATVRLAVRSRFEERARAAGIAAAVAAFIVFAGFDWIWQVPVIPAALLLLVAAVMAPAQRRRRGGSAALTRLPESARPARIIALRGIAVVLGLLATAAVIYPFATGTALAESQAAATDGNLRAALADARQAAAIEPGAAAPELQLALVLELGGDYRAALDYAQRAVHDEPQNWSNWLTLSRLEAECGQPRASVAAYVEAKRLNPQSVLFRSDT